MFAFGWLRVGSFSGCICTRVDFVGCNCAWNMRVYFFCCGGGGGGQVCSPLAGSGLGVSVGAFVPGSNG